MTDRQTPEAAVAVPDAAVVPNTTVVATAAVDQKPSDGSEDAEEEKTTVLQTVSRAAFKLATTAVVYALGYWRLAAASTWVLLPLMACVSAWRDWRHEGAQLRRRRKQLAAVADEKTLITANIAELPSWVFFPDVHRAEWLNQVSCCPVTPFRIRSVLNVSCYSDHQAAVAVDQRVRPKDHQEHGTDGLRESA